MTTHSYMPNFKGCLEGSFIDIRFMHGDLVVSVQKVKLSPYFSHGGCPKDVILTRERGTMFDGVRIQGSIIMYNSGHGIGIALCNHPGSRGDVTARGAYSAGGDMVCKELT